MKETPYQFLLIWRIHQHITYEIKSSDDEDFGNDDKNVLFVWFSRVCHSFCVSFRVMESYNLYTLGHSGRKSVALTLSQFLVLRLTTNNLRCVLSNSRLHGPSARQASAQPGIREHNGVSLSTGPCNSFELLSGIPWASARADSHNAAVWQWRPWHGWELSNRCQKIDWSSLGSLTAVYSQITNPQICENPSQIHRFSQANAETALPACTSLWPHHLARLTNSKKGKPWR